MSGHNLVTHVNAVKPELLSLCVLAVKKEFGCLCLNNLTAVIIVIPMGSCLIESN